MAGAHSDITTAFRFDSKLSFGAAASFLEPEQLAKRRAIVAIEERRISFFMLVMFKNGIYKIAPEIMESNRWVYTGGCPIA